MTHISFQTVPIKQIAFIGTGIMGTSIARHLIDAGYALSVYNRSPKKTEALVAAGARRAQSIADCVKDADLVFTMVGYPDDVEEIYLASDGILKHSKKGAYLIDLTTSSPQLARDIHDAAALENKEAFDCPVTGGEAGAKAGSLALIIGATEQTVAPVLHVLKTFSQKQFYFDAPGSGQAAKLCNQLSLISCMVGMTDAFALAEQFHIDQTHLRELMLSGTGGSAALEHLAPLIFDEDYRPGFLAEHLRKDVGLALASAQDLDITLPGAETGFTLLDMLCEIGGSRLGTQALSLLYQDEASGVAAGLDWSLLDVANEDDHALGECACGCGHDHRHDLGHDHKNDHELDHGHDHEQRHDHGQVYHAHANHHHDHHGPHDHHHAHTHHDHQSFDAPSRKDGEA